MLLQKRFFQDVKTEFIRGRDNWTAKRLQTKNQPKRLASNHSLYVHPLLFFMEKALHRLKHIGFLLQDIIIELFILDILIGAHQCAVPVVLIHFPVSEHIGYFHQLFHQFYTAGIVGGQVIAIGKMERVNIEFVRLVFLMDKFK